jgi:hypothetical protein
MARKGHPKYVSNFEQSAAGKATKPGFDGEDTRMFSHIRPKGMHSAHPGHGGMKESGISILHD